MKPLDRALDLLTGQAVLEGLAAYLNISALHYAPGSTATGGKVADFRPGCEEKTPSLDYRAGHGGPIFTRYGADGLSGGALRLLESAGIAGQEAVALLLEWAGVPDEDRKTGEGMKVGKQKPAPVQRQTKAAASVEKARGQLAKLHPLAPEKHASALRGWARVEAGEETPEALEVARRGLMPLLASGDLVAYRWGPAGGPHKTRTLPDHTLPGALAFDVYGPDGTVWATKARNSGSAEDLARVSEERGKHVDRYVYVTAGQSRPAHVARIAAKEEGQPGRFLFVEGELNGLACFLMLEAVSKGTQGGHVPMKPDARALGWEVQGVASAGAVPHVDHIPEGAQVYIYADPDKSGDEAREAWGALLASKGCQVFQVKKVKGGRGVFSRPSPEDIEAGEMVTQHDACDYLGSHADAPDWAARAGASLLEAIDRALPWQPKVEEVASEEKPGNSKKAPKALTAKAEAVASEEGAGLPTASQIPDPEGQGGSYSDEQVKTLLSLTFPTVAADTDTAHAYRLQTVAGDNLAFIPELGGYAAFNGRQWVGGGKDGPGQVEAKRFVQRLGVAMKPEVSHLLALYGVLAVDAAKVANRHGWDSAEAKAARFKAEAMEKAYFQHARAAKLTESDTRQKAILSSARPLYVKSISHFEPRPWAVGFQNGVWDKGQFRPARREDYMLTLAAVEYLPDADRSDWLEVLHRITGGDADLGRTLQEVAGYALSGAASLRRLPWLYGEGGTGKSTYGETLATVLGEMAVTISPKHLATDADRERLGAVIFGKRAALCAEAGNQRLDAESLKTLSGGDRLAVRKLYAESFTARPSHVLLMVANDAPRVEAYDDALKDRVLALPFTHPLMKGGPLLGGRRIEEVRQDPKSALVRGFTAWAVEGMERVYKTGNIHTAAVCKEATRAFWADVDPLRDFWPALDVSALAVDGMSVPLVRSMYESWAKESGARPMSSQKFNKAAQSVGLAEERKSKRENGKLVQNRVWVLAFPALFPNSGDGEAEDGPGVMTVMTENSPISQKPKISLSRREEIKDFSGNGSNSVITVITEGRAVSASPDEWAGEEDL